MAEFLPAFNKMIKNEGGYVLHKVKGDNGGTTYAGIARNFHENWPGWEQIDQGKVENNPELIAMVKNFYHDKFWTRISGNGFARQEIASTIFDFAVNAGTKPAAKLAQSVVDANPDGLIGPKTLKLINCYEVEEFKIRYAFAKIKKYSDIVNRDRTQNKFLLGWINRTLEGLA